MFGSTGREDVGAMLMFWGVDRGGKGQAPPPHSPLPGKRACNRCGSHAYVLGVDRGGAALSFPANASAAAAVVVQNG